MLCVEVVGVVSPSTLRAVGATDQDVVAGAAVEGVGTSEAQDQVVRAAVPVAAVDRRVVAAACPR